MTDPTPPVLPAGTQDALIALGYTKATIDGLTWAEADAILSRSISDQPAAAPAEPTDVSTLTQAERNAYHLYMRAAEHDATRPAPRIH